MTCLTFNFVVKFWVFESPIAFIHKANQAHYGQVKSGHQVLDVASCYYGQNVTWQKSQKQGQLLFILDCGLFLLS